MKKRAEFQKENLKILSMLFIGSLHCAPKKKTDNVTEMLGNYEKLKKFGKARIFVDSIMF